MGIPMAVLLGRWTSQPFDLILFRRSASSEKNIGLTIVPKDIQFLIVLFLHTYFSALVKPIFFSDDADLLNKIKSKGWDVQRPSKAAIGIPILKYMYLDAMKTYRSKFRMSHVICIHHEPVVVCYSTYSNFREIMPRIICVCDKIILTTFCNDSFTSDNTERWLWRSFTST
jgi:hypothetical protein